MGELKEKMMRELETRTSQQWVEHVYSRLVEATTMGASDSGMDRYHLCEDVVEAIASGEIKGWTTAQKICTLIAKARKA